MGTSKLMDPGAAYPFEVPGPNSPLVVQDLQMGGTSVTQFFLGGSIKIGIVALYGTAIRNQGEGWGDDYPRHAV
jgi:hypothetical protein